MIPKQIIRSVLLLAVFGSLAIWANRQYQKSQAIDAASQAPPAAEELPQVEGDQVIMTYFISGTRCESCETIEALARETAEKDFPDAMSNKSLVFRVIDTGDASRHHYIKDYQLTSKTVILSHRVQDLGVGPVVVVGLQHQGQVLGFRGSFQVSGGFHERGLLWRGRGGRGRSGKQFGGGRRLS